MFKDNRNKFIRQIMEYKPNETIRFQLKIDYTMMYFTTSLIILPLLDTLTWNEIKRAIDRRFEPEEDICSICEEEAQDYISCPKCSYQMCVGCIERIVDINYDKYGTPSCDCPACRFIYGM
jgi:hypothetical protein